MVRSRLKFRNKYPKINFSVTSSDLREYEVEKILDKKEEDGKVSVIEKNEQLNSNCFDKRICQFSI